MDNDNIIPDILPNLPPSKLTIVYPNAKTVDFGNELTPQEVKSAPEVAWQADANKLYTLLMTDPDAPSRNYPFLGEVCHWLVVNVKGCDLSSGEVMSEYAGSGPPRGTGLHRYIFVVFQHEERVTFGGPLKSRMQRLRFSTKKFMEKYKFDKVDAWNYFKAQWTSEPRQESRTCVCM